jgi:D-arginine dehydrogenase
MPEIVDVLIVGGGISGVSMAARLAGRASVVLLEAEEHLGTQSTARSAALFIETYGSDVIRRLTKRGRGFFQAPPDGFTAAPLARRRGGLVYASEEGVGSLREQYARAQRSAEVAWADAEEILKLCPLMRPGVAAAGFLEPNAMDLDANALLQGFARVAQCDGARIHRSASARKIERAGERWLVSTPDRAIACAVIVNAAGAWADQIAELAGVRRRGLQPMRRTAATIEVPPDMAELLPSLPFVTPIDESFYFKPEARSIMVSLSEETPSEPCDAYPEDLDVAIALERFHAATVVPRVRPTATWAGLRTFPPDRNPVVGFDGEAPGFFWYAGQGGYGIQTSPALSALGAKLLLADELDPAEAELAAALDSRRFDG